MSRSTLPLTVSNTGFLLDRLGQDCGPLQYVRELTQNAIEAIKRTREGSGRILWDVDWLGHERSGGPYKLSITDTGDGMSGADMVRYINQLSSSGSNQSIEGNYGVGAKIAAATRNHAGLVYLSWREGMGSTIHMWRDPDSGQYGLRMFARPDGTYSHFADISDDAKPEMIADHGTKIVLLGNSSADNTMLPPKETSAKDRWILKYLNTRYFRIPDGITITAREGLNWKGRDRGLLRNVYGQNHFLADGSECQGTVSLKGAKAHWWIVKDSVNESGRYETSGHVAALYQDELYEMSTGRSGRALLQQFGILFGTNRVVIYLEPTPELGPLTTDTARTRLTVRGEQLPWSDWAMEFRESIPAEIRRLMENVGAKAMFNDHEKAIRERLKPILELYRVSRYRLDPTAKDSIDARSLTLGGEPKHPGNQVSRGGGSGASGSRVAGGVYGNFLKKPGVRASEIHPDVFPKVTWVSIEDNSRVAGDMEDRAARYLPEQNRLFINGDFRAFADMVDRLAGEFGALPGARETCKNVIHGWFEQTLVEAVIGIQGLKESPEWSQVEIHEALSEEALTMAVMPRYFVNHASKRDIAVKLGRST